MFGRNSMYVTQGWVEDHTSKFTGAQRYVKEGLKKDSIFYPSQMGKFEIEGPVWNDTTIVTDIKGKTSLNHSYEKEFKDKEIIDAARFRDALVGVEDWEEGHGLESFRYAFDETWCWTDAYKKTSKKIFNFLVQDVALEKCTGTHKFTESATSIDSDGSSDEESASNSDELAGFALCETAHYDLCLMRYHIRNCMGVQSDRLWRDKVFQLLYDEVVKLPKKNYGAAKKSQETKMSWLHAVCVVLASLDEWKDLIYNRVNEPDDIQPLLDISDRVSATVKHLITFGVFNSNQMSKALAFLTFKMESVARYFVLNTHSLRDFWDGEKPFLFGGSRANGAFSTCKKLVKTYAERFADISPPPVQVSPPSQVAAANSTVQKSPPQSMKRSPQELSEAPRDKKMRCLCQ